MANASPKPAAFIDRIKPRHSQPSAPTHSVKIVDAENDIPFEQIEFLRIGSAHAVCEPVQDAENINLLLRLSMHTLSRYEPDLLPAKVMVEYKSGPSSREPDDDVFTHTATIDSACTASSRFEPSFLDRQWIKGLYLCVLVQGQLAAGASGYCYFGVFADTLVDFVDRYQAGQPFNPNQLKAIVLARATGEPTVDIREFMRWKFSFDHTLAILEISRSS